ncbi:TetR family transcriptional regulator [Mycobacterium paraffinicum]|uniref:TetR family transcriptional regulator n=1 Tax=Mycobacterium paraffinicum TaxID=53378 RepID=A0A1Q4HPV8_9MYCO|nr:TetR/AcrR family transcriptional regulator [Mycobacterium paraffinicum]OJZ69934.1 TetR family transcriptional regulator [Mycobacterium paraffinicum]
MTAAVSSSELPAGDARQRILQTTIQCFCAYGYEKSSMKLISTKAGVSQTLLHYHFETKEKLFQAAIDDMAKRMFATAATRLPHRTSVREGLTGAAGLMYALFIDNIDAVTFMVEFAAAANHNEFLRTAYVDYRDKQRRQLGEAFRRIAGDGVPQRLIDESVRLFETVLLGMSMQRPFVSDTSAFRRDFDVFAQLLAARITAGLEPGR